VLDGGAIVSSGVVAYQPASGFIVYGPVASDLVVGSGATDYVLTDGTTTSTTVGSGGTESIYDGGMASGTVVNDLGRQYVSLGGVAVSTTLNSGSPNSAGEQFVVFGGTAVSTTLNSGSIEFVDPGGAASATMVNSGGAEVVSSGGTAISTIVDSGGIEMVVSSSTVSLTTVNLGGSIDAVELIYASGGSATVNTSGLLTVSVNGATYTQQLAGDYTDVAFQLAPGPMALADTGVLITAEVRCFRSGTRILTDRGEIAVENLQIGDLAHTIRGETPAPITWIGHRHVDCARHPHPQKVWPVRVAAGAFGPGRPHTDLFLSPDHAVYIDDVLIPIRHLINAGTITQIPTDRVTYYHLELPHHDILLAQGLPTESFLDLRDGSNYANRPGPTSLYPDHTAQMWEAFACAPLIVTGPQLAAARRLLARRAPRKIAA
jgi:autotransporter passenger strand-loop-strand repeat protein